MACILQSTDFVSGSCQPFADIAWVIRYDDTNTILSTFNGTPAADATGVSLGVIGGTFLEPEVEFGLYNPSTNFRIEKTGTDDCGNVDTVETIIAIALNTTDAIDEDFTSLGYLINTVYNIDLLANDTDPETDNFAVTAIDGNAVVVATPIVLNIGGSTLTITPLANGTFDISSDLPITNGHVYDFPTTAGTPNWLTYNFSPLSILPLGSHKITVVATTAVWNFNYLRCISQETGISTPARMELGDSYYVLSPEVLTTINGINGINNSGSVLTYSINSDA